MITKERLIQLAEDAGLVNHYEITDKSNNIVNDRIVNFVNETADTDNVMKFTELIINVFKEDLERLRAYDDVYKKKVERSVLEWLDKTEKNWPIYVSWHIDNQRDRLNTYYEVEAENLEYIKELEKELEITYDEEHY